MRTLTFYKLALFVSFFPGLLLAIECKIGERGIGSINGSSWIDWNSLVSKAPEEKLSPLAAPAPLRQLPVHFLNPYYQEYYKKVGSQEYLREDAAISLIQLISKAQSEGHEIYIHSAYRSFQTQCDVFKKKVFDHIKSTGRDLESAIAYINTKSALPGESEHQLGMTADLVVDIPQIGYKLEHQFAHTPAYHWLQQRAHEYGYVLSFPQAKGVSESDPHPRTGIIFEPWHWRYLGSHYARIFYDCHGEITVQEFLRKLKLDPAYRCQEFR